MILGLRCGQGEAERFALPRITAGLRGGADERREALELLRDIGPGANIVLDDLMALLHGSPGPLDPLLIDVLRGIGAPALNALDASARRGEASAFRALAGLGRPAARLLVSLLDAEHSGLRWRALNALDQIGPELGQLAIDAVLRRCDDPRLAVRRRAVQALRSMPVRVERALPRLIERLADNRAVAREALETIGAFGSKALAATPALLAILERPEKKRRAAAARALARVWADEPGRLLAFFQGASPRTRRALISRIGVAGREAVPCLVAALSDGDNRIRRGALESLRALGPDAREAEGAVRALAKRTSVKGRDFAFCRRALAALVKTRRGA